MRVFVVTKAEIANESDRAGDELNDHPEAEVLGVFVKRAKANLVLAAAVMKDASVNADCYQVHECEVIS